MTDVERMKSVQQAQHKLSARKNGWKHWRAHRFGGDHIGRIYWIVSATFASPRSRFLPPVGNCVGFAQFSTPFRMSARQIIASFNEFNYFQIQCGPRPAKVSDRKMPVSDGISLVTYFLAIINLFCLLTCPFDIRLIINTADGFKSLQDGQVSYYLAVYRLLSLLIRTRSQ